jgi:hypothetical protein
MKVTKYTLLVDDAWKQEILDKMYPFVESDEVFQLLDETEVEVCDDCQVYLTSDSEVIMDVFRCPDQKEFCLNCCGCPEHETEEEGLHYV